MLIAARKESGITQVEIAERLEKPQSYVSKYERGERRLDFAEFVTIACLLKIDINDFLNSYLAAISPMECASRRK